MQRATTNTTPHESPDIGLYDSIQRARIPEQTEVQSLPKKHSTSLLAKRYELKYRVSESTAMAVRSFVSSYLEVDKYALRQPSRQYPICSLYLDSPRYDLFNETILDKCNRFKLRIRGYDDYPNGPLFFEIKRKLNNIIYKSRAKVGKDQLRPVLNGYYVPRDLPEKDRTTLKQFIHYCQCLQARPTVLVRYMRQAYENTSDSRVRITFDRQLCYQRIKEPVFKLNGQGWRPLPIDFVVLEIKFTTNFPLWLKDMVRLFGLNRQSMSKYCSSVRHLVPGAAGYYSIPRR